MTDRENVIACLQFMKRDVLEGSDNDKTLDQALALLKEQQQLIDEITQRRANNGAFD